MAGTELEMPAAFLDAVTLDTVTTTPACFNRDPEPDEIGVPVDTLISVDFSDIGSDGLDLTSIEVFILGVLAYDNDGGGFQTGFDGPGSTTSAPDADTLRVVIDPTSDFASLQQVSVRKFAQTLLAPIPDVLDLTYVFTCEDLTPPKLVSAITFELKRIRVSADEALKSTDATASDDALNPANWTVTPATVASTEINAAVEVEVLSVEKVNDQIFDLITDIEPSFNGLYDITATNIEDVSDNVIIPPDNVVQVLGFQCPFPIERRFSFFRLFPLMNRLEDVTRDLEKFSAVMQDTIDLLLCDIDRFTTLSDIDRAPEPFVDLILLDLGNPFRFDLDLNKKRRLAKILVDIYRLKGTKVGIIDAVAFFLGLEIDIIPLAEEGWILGESDIGDTTILFPSLQFNIYAFQVVVDLVLTAAEREGITQIVELMKPGHTHFVRIVEPVVPPAIDHLELGISELGKNWILH